MYTELDHNLRAPVQYDETSTQEGKQRSGWRQISNSVCTECEKPRSKAFKQDSTSMEWQSEKDSFVQMGWLPGSQKQRTACLIFRGGRYNEHSEINEIGQREYNKRDGKGNTRARQCKLWRKLFTWPMKHAPKMKMIVSHERQTRQQLPQKFIYICCPKSCNFVWWDPWDISASQNPPLGVGDGRGRILKAYLHNLSVYLVQVSWCAVIIGLKSTLNVCISTLFSL